MTNGCYIIHDLRNDTEIRCADYDAYITYFQNDSNEAIKQGYVVFEIRLQRGYVSRKTTLDTAQVLEAGGRRKGQKYWLWPHETSTQYCYRMYIRK